MPVLPAVIGWIPALVGVTAQLDYARVTRCNWTMPCYLVQLDYPCNEGPRTSDLTPSWRGGLGLLTDAIFGYPTLVGCLCWDDARVVTVQMLEADDVCVTRCNYWITYLSPMPVL